MPTHRQAPIPPLSFSRSNNRSGGVIEMRRRIFILLWLLTIAGILMATGRLAEAFSVEIAPAELSLKAGERYVSFVTVNNDSEEPAYLKVYLGDWRDVANGTQYFDPGELPRGLSRWMQVSPSRLTVPPGGSEKVYYEITMPEDPNLAGSYWGMVFVEGLPRQSQEHTEATEGSTFAVKYIIRYAANIYVTVPGTEIRQAAFTGAKVLPVKGGFDMTATLENKGNIYLKPRVWLELRDQTGITVYSEDHMLVTVLPESKRDYMFELRNLNLSPGRYTALIIADYDAPSLIAAQAEIEIKGQ